MKGLCVVNILLTVVYLARLTYSTKSVHPWMQNSDQCTITSTHCVPISSGRNRTCLGTQLPYDRTAPQPLVDDVALYDLHMWKALRAIPACWDKLQYFLCAIYMPECVEDNVTAGFQGHSSMDSSSNRTSMRFGNLRSDTDSSKSATSNASSNQHGYRVILPEAQMCEAVHKACPLLVSGVTLGASSSMSSENKLSRSSYMLMHPLPRFLNCAMYTPGCRQNALTSRLFQSTGGDCQPPLVTTTVHQNWLKGMERCSFPCRQPHFDLEHYTLARWITGSAAAFCLLVNAFALITLLLQRSEHSSFVINQSNNGPLSSDDRCDTTVVIAANRKRSNGHTKLSRPKPPVLMNDLWPVYYPCFYMHLFLLIACLGWLMPLVPRIGEKIACREDGTIRTGEPQVSSAKSVFCVINFITIYFSSLVAAVWSNVFDHLVFTRTRYLVRQINLMQEASSKPTSITINRFTSTNDHSATTPTERSSLFRGWPGRSHASRGKKLRGNNKLDVSADGDWLNLSPSLSTDRMLEPLRSPVTHVETPTVVSGCSLGKVVHTTPGQPVCICESSDETGTELQTVTEYSQRSLSAQLFVTDQTTLSQVPETGGSNKCRHTPSASHGVLTCPRCTRAIGMLGTRRTQISSQYTLSSGPQSGLLTLLAFALPLSLVLTSLTVAEIDGDALTGICSIGRVNVWARLGLVIVPCTICLVVKCVYLGQLVHLFRRLQQRFSVSLHPVDQEFAQRLGRCAYSYVLFLSTLIVLWLFSMFTQTYVFLYEPDWLESQRALVLCQLSHRLLGLDAQTAQKVCLSSAVTAAVNDARTPYTSVTIDPAVPNGTQRAMVATQQPVKTMDTNAAVPTMWSGWSEPPMRPSVGPILLHLLVFFALNLIVASACLLDGSIRRCWRYALLRLKQSSVAQQDDYPPDDLLPIVYTTSTGFSWWDPGIFTPSYINRNLPVIAKGSIAESGINNSSPIPSTDRVASIDPSPFTDACSVPRVPESCEPSGAPCWPPGMDYADLVNQLVRLSSLYEENEGGQTASISPFRQLLDQLVTHEDPVLESGVERRSNSAESEAPDSTGLNGGAPSDLFASMASAVYEECCRQLATAPSGHRRHSRLHRVFNSRKSMRRRSSHSRSSLSTTTGLFYPTTASGPSSIVSGPASATAILQSASDHQTPTGAATSTCSESLSLLQAAAATASMVASLRASGGVGGSLSQSDGGGEFHPRPDEGARWVLGESRVSSSAASAQSISTRRGFIGQYNSSLPYSRPASLQSGADVLLQRSRNVIPLPTDVGDHTRSHTSLRSLSCASSSGAESYNSYRLMVNQAGASWRELIRTRLLLKTVLHWAEDVAPLMKANQRSQSSVNEIGLVPPSSMTGPKKVDAQPSIPYWTPEFGALVASFIQQQQNPRAVHAVPSTPLSSELVGKSIADSNVSSPVASVPNSDVDHVMAAALAAATAAATMAFQQQQQQNLYPVSVAPNGSYTAPYSSLEVNHQTATNSDKHLPACSYNPVYPPHHYSHIPDATPSQMTRLPFSNHSPLDPSTPRYLASYPSPHSTPTTLGTMWQHLVPANPTIYSAPPPPPPDYSSHPYYAHRHPSSAGMLPCQPKFRCSPDLLIDHDRKHMNATSPPQPPMFSLPAATSNMFWVPPPGKMNQPHHPTQPSPLNMMETVPASYRPTNVYTSDPRQFTAGPSRTRRSYPSTPQRMIYEASTCALSATIPARKLEDHTNDSDEFDSEDEVMSDHEDMDSVTAPVLPKPFCPPSALPPCHLASHPYSSLPIHSSNTAVLSDGMLFPSHLAPQVDMTEVTATETDIELSSVSQSASQVGPRRLSLSSDASLHSHSSSASVSRSPMGDAAKNLTCSNSLDLKVIDDNIEVLQ